MNSAPPVAHFRRRNDSAVLVMMMITCSLMYSDVGLTYWGQTVTNACAWFSVALHPQKPYGSLGRGAQDGHLDFHSAPELSVLVKQPCTSHDAHTLLDTCVTLIGWGFSPRNLSHRSLFKGMRRYFGVFGTS